MDKIINGDCLEAFKTIPDNSVDLIVTSPPYAQKRSKTYGGIPSKQYVGWFLNIASAMVTVLKPTGSLILNIKEGASDGERETYVMELILAMRNKGWLWTEEYIWCKNNSFPGKWPNRFRDAWEHCYHFTLTKNFAMYQDEVKVPVGDWAKARLSNMSAADKTRRKSSTGSGCDRNISNWVGRDMVYPTNVIHLPTESSNKSHSAAFPVGLPSWFIRLFTKPGDLVLDPFCGSGTTCVAAKQLGRHYIGIDVSAEYCELAKTRLEESAVRFPEAIK